jgi:AAA domain
MSAFDTFQQAVQAAGLKMDNMRRDGFRFTCNIHDDKVPSVNVDYRNGRVLVRCHAGDDTRDIVHALGLEMTDLFDEEPDQKNNHMVVAEYRYYNPYTKELAFTKERLFPKSFRIYRTVNGEKQYSLGGEKPWLYNSDALVKAVPAGEVIWIVEGEADVHSMGRMGATATTQPHGAGHGKWTAFHSSMLTNAKEVRIVVDMDQSQKDGTNIGRDYAMEVRNSLVAVGVKASLWKPAAGKDATDHLTAGFGIEDFKRYDLGQMRPKGIDGDNLMTKEFPPLVWAVEDILPQGVCLFAAPPKAGKSFIAVDVAVAVACGGKALGRIGVTQGDVLYIGLEDSERRLQDRVFTLTEGEIPECMDRIEWQTIDSGWVGGDAGLSGMQEWVDSVDDPRLIVIDTLRKHEPQLDEAKNSYLVEQELMLRYKRFADRYNLTILFVHHDNKANDDGDWLNKFSGTKGLTGGADTLWYLDFKRGDRTGFLRIDGRDVVADDVPIHKVKGRPFWIADECPNDLSELMDVTEFQERILNHIREYGPTSVDALRTIFPGSGLDQAATMLIVAGRLSVDEQNIVHIV